MWCLPAICMVLVAAGCAREQSVDARVAAFAALPDWSGVWTVEGLEVGIDGFPQIAVDVDAQAPIASPLAIFNQGAPLTPAARARTQAFLGKTKGDVAKSPDGSDGWGFPLMMSAPPPLQFVITPEETLIFNAYRDLRRIYTDGRSRPPVEDRWPPTTWGDSLGHWEGDTLVIETIDVRDPALYFGVVMPFSAKARYTERLRRTGPDRIEGEMTIEDPETLERPMTVPLVYRRETELDRLIMDSFSSDRTGFDGEFNTIEPPSQ